MAMSALQRYSMRCAKGNCVLKRGLISTPSSSSPRRTSQYLQRWLDDQEYKQFGNYSRIVPQTLLASKPLPKSPSYTSVPAHILRPPYAGTGAASSMDLRIPILTADEIEKIRTASIVARDALALGGSMVRAGLSTKSIDTELHSFILSQKAYPSCLNYMGFPNSICTSINNVIAHGIPDSRQLGDGDIINIDVTVYKDGFHGDTSATFAVGNVDKPGMDLVNATQESLELAIQACGPGVPLCLIGETIGSFAESLGYSVSEELTGHGIGRDFHQNPLVYHHINDEPGVMEAGMAFTIEPILCQGEAGGLQWPDGWTIGTLDGGRSAQFEHTILVTDGGVEILTA
ncbi:hypothetical protein H4R24_005636 [Coemansia sp. RSA 988]|nr:hypothetical protein H4R24_005636 [Coemansia sp. RSA 988]